MKTILDFYTSLTRKSAHEYCGPCPWCGGRDRFIVWTNKGKGGQFYCRQCQEKGDGIAFLMKEGFSFHKALRELDLENTGYDSGKAPLPRFAEFAVAAPQDEILLQPNPLWQKQASKFIEDCWQETQLKSYSEYMMLTKARFLEQSTLEQFKIGWNSRDRYFPAEEWGLFGKKIRIPKGMLIPSFQDQNITSLKVRCSDLALNPKYWQVRGGSSAPMLLGQEGNPVVIVESALDAYLIFQEARDHVSVVALGGTDKPIIGLVEEVLDNAPRIFISTDYDEIREGELGPGQRAMLKIRDRFNRAEYLPPAIGQDATEMVALGIAVKQWFAFMMPNLAKRELTSIPPGFIGELNETKRLLIKHPELVPCPKQKQPWLWIYRASTSCSSCKGHIHCLKDIEV